MGWCDLILLAIGVLGFTLRGQVFQLFRYTWKEEARKITMLENMLFLCQKVKLEGHEINKELNKCLT